MIDLFKLRLFLAVILNHTLHRKYQKPESYQQNWLMKKKEQIYSQIACRGHFHYCVMNPLCHFCLVPWRCSPCYAHSEQPQTQSPGAYQEVWQVVLWMILSHIFRCKIRNDLACLPGCAAGNTERSWPVVSLPSPDLETASPHDQTLHLWPVRKRINFITDFWNQYMNACSCHETQTKNCQLPETA